MHVGTKALEWLLKKKKKKKKKKKLVGVGLYYTEFINPYRLLTCILLASQVGKDVMEIIIMVSLPSNYNLYKF